MLSSPVRAKLPLLKIEKASHNDTYSFYFDRKFFHSDFLPGQYLKVVQEGVADERGNSRFFTVASSPTELQYIMITTRIMRSPFKHALYGLQIGDSISVTGPFGNFVLDERYVTPRVFIGGGIGITPFRSMSIYARDKKLSIPLTVFASFSIPPDVIYYNELTHLTTGAPYKAVFTITRPEKSKEEWSGEVGRLDKEKFLKYISNPFECLYFIAGPKSMVDGLTNTVKEIGVVENNIKIENFPGY